MIHFMQGVSTKDFRERAPDLSPGEGHCLVFLYTLLPQCFALHNKVNGQKGTVKPWLHAKFRSAN